MIHYIIQIVAFQLLFIILYDLFLNKETFFTWNRLYLLITPILSFVLPLLKIKAIQETIPEGYFIELPAVLLNGYSQDTAFDGGTLQEVVIIGTQPINLVSLLLNIWIIGVGISLGLFIFKMIKIQRLKRSGTIKRFNGIKIVTLPNTDTAFSFFNTMFIGENLSENQRTSILLHENIHIKQYHSLDLLFFEIQRIICWFNPLVYIYQNKMMMLQEYTADAKAVYQSDKKSYYQDLLAQVFQTENISFINTFFNHSLIKKRIIMLQKSKSKQIAKIKYLFLLPVIAIMLFYTACTSEAVNAQETADSVTSTDSEVLQSIQDLKEVIARQGTITEEEQKALKSVLQLTTSKGSGDLHFEDKLEREEVPFAVIERVPTFPGCSGLESNDELKKCMSSKISQHVGKEFDASVSKESGLTGDIKIFVSFKIDKKGDVVNIRSRAPSPSLQKEAIRVIETLPRMIPGEQKGKAVGVLYSLPILFKIEE